MGIENAVSQAAHLLQLAFPDFVLYLEPPVFVGFIIERCLYPLFQRVAMNLAQVYGISMPDYFMVLGCLLENDIFALLAIFVSWDVALLHVGIRNLSLEFIVLG